jgi:phosphate transport system protein
MTTRVKFERDLQFLRDHVLRLGSMIDTAINNAIRALVERDLELASQIITDDEIINDLRFEVEEFCLALIAKQQPMASDLRMIVTAMHVAMELERMGDHAKGIAVIVQQMAGQPPVKPLIDIPHMADIVLEMLHQSLDAFLTGNSPLAKAVAQRDDEVDRLYTQIFRELISHIIEDPNLVTRATFLLFVAHNLERVADRVVNICERVIFLTTGRLEEFPSDAPNITAMT